MQQLNVRAVKGLVGIKGGSKGFCTKVRFKGGGFQVKKKAKKPLRRSLGAFSCSVFCKKTRFFDTFFQKRPKIGRVLIKIGEKCFRYPLNSTATPPTGFPGGSEKGSE
jgi:hypothetical protein